MAESEVEVYKKGAPLKENPSIKKNLFNKENPQNYLKIGAWALLGIFVLMVLFSSFTIVDAGYMGVVKRLGAVQRTVNEGLHFKLPFVDEIVEVEVRVQKAESQQTAASRDMQMATTSVAVNYHLSTEVGKLYQQVGLAYRERVIDPSVSEAVKAVTAQYSADELISKRGELSTKIKENLGNKLVVYGILLDEINITDFKFSDKFSQAIEAKQTAEQEALKAKNELERVKIEAEQKVANAKAEAEALRLQKQQITPELLRLREIEMQKEAIAKWDGKLPQYMMGDSVPMINLNPGK